MTSFAPLCLAFLLNCCGIYIFTRRRSYDNLPYLSYVIFLISVYLLLCRVNVIPNHFRKLYRWAQLIIEFAVIMLVMEFIVNNLWYPLELGIISFLKHLPHTIATVIKSLGFTFNACSSLKFLKSPNVLMAASYMLSLFFFLSIGHATKILDLRILTECGIYYFVLEAADRIKTLAKEMMPMPKEYNRRKRRGIYSSRGNCEDDDTQSTSSMSCSSLSTND